MSIEIEVYSEFGVPFRMENNLVVWEPEAGQSIPDENLVVKKIVPKIQKTHGFKYNS